MTEAAPNIVPALDLFFRHSCVRGSQFARHAGHVRAAEAAGCQVSRSCGPESATLRSAGTGYAATVLTHIPGAGALSRSFDSTHLERCQSLRKLLGAARPRCARFPSAKYCG